MQRFYISFGQIHAHSIPPYPTFDKDCIAVVKASTKSEAHEKAIKLFGPKFAFVYDNLPEMEYFPRGLIHIDE